MNNNMLHKRTVEFRFSGRAYPCEFWWQSAWRYGDEMDLIRPPMLVPRAGAVCIVSLFLWALSVFAGLFWLGIW